MKNQFLDFIMNLKTSKKIKIDVTYAVTLAGISLHYGGGAFFERSCDRPVLHETNHG